MDGTLAVIFAVVSLTDMALTDCPTGCLASRDAPQRLSFQVADVAFQDAIIGSEVYLGYDIGRGYGPFDITVAASVTDQGAAWIGAGAQWTSERTFGGPVFFEASFMPGLYSPGDGPDLGGALHFRSALGVGYRFDNGASLTMSYDHRSNGDTQDLNPGLETLSIRYALAFD